MRFAPLILLMFMSCTSITSAAPYSEAAGRNNFKSLPTDDDSAGKETRDIESLHGTGIATRDEDLVKALVTAPVVLCCLTTIYLLRYKVCASPATQTPRTHRQARRRPRLPTRQQLHDLLYGWVGKIKDKLHPPPPYSYLGAIELEAGLYRDDIPRMHAPDTAPLPDCSNIREPPPVYRRVPNGRT